MIPKLLLNLLCFMLMFTLASTATTRAGSVLSLYTQTWKGDLTYYGPLTGLGNCALLPLPSWTSQLTWGLAMNAQQYASGDQCQACGVCLRGTYLGTGLGSDPPPATFTAIVFDQCPECAVGDIDIAVTGDGRWQVSWQAVDCPVGSSTLQWEFEGSNQWYMKLGVRNSRIAVTKLEVQTTSSGKWVTATRTQDNFFECSSCPYPMKFPMPVRVTGVNDEVLTDMVPRLEENNLVYLQGSNHVQFSPFKPASDSTTSTLTTDATTATTVATAKTTVATAKTTVATATTTTSPPAQSTTTVSSSASLLNPGTAISMTLGLSLVLATMLSLRCVESSFN